MCWEGGTLQLHRGQNFHTWNPSRPHIPLHLAAHLYPLIVTYNKLINLSKCFRVIIINYQIKKGLWEPLIYPELQLVSEVGQSHQSKLLSVVTPGIVETAWCEKLTHLVSEVW